jgi:excisionase family DNA binding protein
MKSDIDKPDEIHYPHNDEAGSEDVKVSVETKLERLLTIQEISELLKVPKSYVYWLTHQKKIPHLKIQGHLRFRQSHIEEWLRSQEVRDVSIQEEVRDRE